MSLARVQIEAQMRLLRNPPMFTQYEYECRPWPVTCEYCDRKAIDTEQSLRQAGWQLGSEEICPECKERV